MRPSLEEIFMNTAVEFSKRSTCISHQVGCVLVKDRRIISNGYNGVVNRDEHCTEVHKGWDMTNEVDRGMHRSFSSINEIHAEQNAIGFCAKHGISTFATSLYCTLEPCESCAKLIIAAGIRIVYYANEYDHAAGGRKFLERHNVPCVKFNI